MAKTPNKEKSYQKSLESQCSDQRWKHLELTFSDPPGRVRAYVHWHLHNKHKRSMYKPAPYLTHPSCPYQLELLRIRTQHTIHIYPPTSITHSEPHEQTTRTGCARTVLTKAQQYSEMKSTSYVTAQQQRGCYNNSLLNSKGSHDYLTSPPSRPSHQTR